MPEHDDVIGLVAGGVGGLAVGMPLLFAGDGKVKRAARQRAELRLMATMSPSMGAAAGASVALRF